MGRRPTEDEAWTAMLRIRMSKKQLRWISQRAEADGDDRSEWTRRALRFANAYMPKDWHRAGDPVPWEGGRRAARPGSDSGGGDLRHERYVEQP